MARGRKPAGNYSDLSTQLAIRMPVDLRKRLEASAKRRKDKRTGKSWNLSQEVLYRLDRSLERDREERRDPASRALCLMLAELINMVAANTVGGSNPVGWRSDPFAFRTIKLAFTRILDTFEEDLPRGEIKRRRDFASVMESEEFDGHYLRQFIGGETPEETASIAASALLFWFQSSGRPCGKGENDQPAATPSLHDSDYGMAHAWRDLQIKRGQ